MTKKLTIYCNRKPVIGPWGGGNRILQSFINAATVAGHNVIHSLLDAFRNDIHVDVIFCMDPRQGATSDELSYNAIMSLFPNKMQRPFIVQRIGDIGTHGKPELGDLVAKTVPLSDLVIFPSVWCRDAVESRLYSTGAILNDCVVVYNTPDVVFYKNWRPPNIQKNISFTTHHWSTNPKKGFAFYNELNEWCKTRGHTFTFYGRVPDTATFASAGVFNADELAQRLPMHDIYITASEEEAGANHVLEAMACGLPVLYHVNGGSIPEYVGHFGGGLGAGFCDINTFELALNKILHKIQYKEALKHIDYIFVKHPAGEIILEQIALRV